ncbi:MAG: TRAM domain-containing protein, partial [Polyangiaceae bacterium]
SCAGACRRRMKRGHGGERLRKVVTRLRDAVDGLTFRTAFIVGHPGETDDEFAELEEFVSWASFDRVGVFRYSDEESAASHALEGKVDDDVAAERYERLMAMAKRIARDNNRKLVGQELEVLVEGVSDEHELVLMGRHRGQAPEIDGQVYLSGTEMVDAPLSAGQMVRVAITQSSDYDLAGEVLGVVASGPSESRQADPRRVTLRVLSSDNRSLS